MGKRGVLSGWGLRVVAGLALAPTAWTSELPKYQTAIESNGVLLFFAKSGGSRTYRFGGGPATKFSALPTSIGHGFNADQKYVLSAPAELALITRDQLGQEVRNVILSGPQMTISECHFPGDQCKLLVGTGAASGISVEAQIDYSGSMHIFVKGLPAEAVVELRLPLKSIYARSFFHGPIYQSMDASSALPSRSEIKANFNSFRKPLEPAVTNPTDSSEVEVEKTQSVEASAGYKVDIDSKLHCRGTSCAGLRAGDQMDSVPLSGLSDGASTNRSAALIGRVGSNDSGIILQLDQLTDKPSIEGLGLSVKRESARQYAFLARMKAVNGAVGFRIQLTPAEDFGVAKEDFGDSDGGGKLDPDGWIYWGPSSVRDHGVVVEDVLNNTVFGDPFKAAIVKSCRSYAKYNLSKDPKNPDIHFYAKTKDVQDCLDSRCRLGYCPLDYEKVHSFAGNLKSFFISRHIRLSTGKDDSSCNDSDPQCVTWASYQRQRGVHTLVTKDGFAPTYSYPGLFGLTEMRAVDMQAPLTQSDCEAAVKGREKSFSDDPAGRAAMQKESVKLLECGTRLLTLNAHKAGFRVLFYTGGFQYSPPAYDTLLGESVPSDRDAWSIRGAWTNGAALGSTYFYRPDATTADKAQFAFHRANVGMQSRIDFMTSGKIADGVFQPGLGVSELIRRYGFDGVYVDTPQGGCEWQTAPGQGCHEGVHKYLSELYRVVHTLSADGIADGANPALSRRLMVIHDSFSPKTAWAFSDILYQGEFIDAPRGDLMQGTISCKEGLRVWSNTTIPTKLMATRPALLNESYWDGDRCDKVDAIVARTAFDPSFFADQYGARWTSRQVFTSKGSGTYVPQKGGIQYDSSAVAMVLLHALTIPKGQRMGPPAPSSADPGQSMNLLADGKFVQPGSFFSGMKLRRYDERNDTGATFWKIMDSSTGKADPNFLVSGYLKDNKLYLVVANFNPGEASVDSRSLSADLGFLGVKLRGSASAKNLYESSSVTGVTNNGVLSLPVSIPRETSNASPPDNAPQGIRTNINFRVFEIAVDSL